MKQRIRGAIVGVCAIVLLSLGIPLAVVIHRFFVNAEVVELQAAAATAVGEIDVPPTVARLREFAHESEAPDVFAAYDARGRRIYGRGPIAADGPVRRALLGTVASSTRNAIVVAAPIVETKTEKVRGVLRLSEPLAGAENRAGRAYVLMVAGGVIALVMAWLLGGRVARRLSEPLIDLARRAERIGDEPAPTLRDASGIPEIDTLAVVLEQRARDVSAALRRERQLTADVSHQMRTPLTALRLHLEDARRTAPTGLEAAFLDVQRLEDTIDHLVAVARDATPTPGRLELGPVVVDAIARWRRSAEAAGRVVTTGSLPSLTASAHQSSLDQVLDVLIDNALRYGRGDVVVSVRAVSDAVAVDVADAGDAIDPLLAEHIFARGHGQGTGIGLSVARAIAEADGGRLVLSRHQPTTFSLILPT